MNDTQLLESARVAKALGFTVKVLSGMLVHVQHIHPSFGCGCREFTCGNGKSRMDTDHVFNASRPSHIYGDGFSVDGEGNNTDFSFHDIVSELEL